MRYLFLALALIGQAHAFTLNNNFGASFKDPDVDVTVDNLTTCANSQLTVYDLQALIGPSVDNFWNKVPTSRLRLKEAGFTTTTNINSGKLCAPTDEACITAAGANVIAPVNGIVIACNNNALNFGDPNVLAVTIPNNFSGKKILGAVILINENSTIFAGLSRSDKIGVISHEIGHAIGLGHTDQSAAMMYYRTVDQRKALGEDDMRGVSYLYPMQIDGGGLLGGCGTISSHAGTPPGNPPFWQMGATLALIILILESKKLLKRPQARSAT